MTNEVQLLTEISAHLADCSDIGCYIFGAVLFAVFAYGFRYFKR